MSAIAALSSPGDGGDGSGHLSIGLQTIYERHAERAAAMALSGVSFVDCVRANLGADHTSITVTHIGPRKGAEQLRIRAEDVYEAWKAFLSADDVRGARLRHLTAFVGEFEALTSEFMTWLTTAYTPRYRVVSTFSDRHWLESVARLALARRIMENKHHERFNGAFVDDLARRITETLILLRDVVMPNVAKASWHAGSLAEKHGGDNLSSRILEDVNRALLAIARSAMNGDAQPLPHLPAHVTPFCLLPERTSVASTDEGAIQ